MVEILNFKKFEKGSLQGFFTVRLPKISLEIRGCSLHSKDGKHWVNLPSKPYKKEDGTEGWSYIVRWVDKKVYDRFQQEVLEALQLHQGNEDDPGEDVPF